jgi:hypothetical protein
MEKLHTVVQEFKMILLAIETGKKLWQIIIKKELT